MGQIRLTEEEMEVARKQSRCSWNEDYERYYATEGATEPEDVALYMSRGLAKAQLKKVVELIERKIKDYEPRLSKHVRSKRLIRALSLRNDIVIAQLELKGEIICLKELRQALLKEIE